MKVYRQHVSLEMMCSGHQVFLSHPFMASPLKTTKKRSVVVLAWEIPVPAGSQEFTVLSTSLDTDFPDVPRLQTSPRTPSSMYRCREEKNAREQTRDTGGRQQVEKKKKT